MPEDGRQKAVEVVTFGCRLNLYESEVMRENAARAGLERLVVVNTCAVTSQAERQARQAIRKARRENPDSLLVVTGCAAQISPEKYAAMPEVDLVVNNEDKMKAATFEKIASLRAQRSNPESQEAKAVRFDSGLLRAAGPRNDERKIIRGFPGGIIRGFVQVQGGCDHACTYCVIPQGRGPSRSVPMQTIIDQTRLLVREGYGEISLTGVDATSYGADLPGTPSFGLMVKRLLMQVPELKRVRLSSLDPSEMDEDLWRLIENEPRLMPHLHLSLQSGDDMILKRMKRRHGRKDIEALVARARAVRPEMVFGADVIAGFPTETDERFENTAALLEDLDFTWLHVFPYSARPGTPAAKMPQVPALVRKERAARLREIGKKAVHRHIESLVGKEIEAFVEQPFLGRSPTFAEVALAREALRGQIIKVRGLRREEERLVGA